MKAFAVHIPNRTIRVFDSLPDAMNQATVGEQVFTSAASIERQHSYDIADLSAFLDDLNGGRKLFFAHKLEAARVVFEHLQAIGENRVIPTVPNPFTREEALQEIADSGQEQVDGTAEEAVAAVQAVRAEMAAEAHGDVMVAVSPEAVDEVIDAAEIDGRVDTGEWLVSQEGDDAGGVPETDVDKLHRYRAEKLAAISQQIGRAATIGAAYRSADAGGELAQARSDAAEREVMRLLVRLGEQAETGLALARDAVFRIEALGRATLPEIQARSGVKPVKEAKPKAGRKPGETRGRRSSREGKLLFPSPQLVAPPNRNTRKGRSLAIVQENPGILFERYLELGGDQADLGVLIAAKTIEARDPS